MYFRAIATATPEMRYTKAQCLEAFERSEWFTRSMEQAARLQFLVLPKPSAPELLAQAILAAVKKSR